MTIALKVQRGQSANSFKLHRVWQPAFVILALLYRLWWHTYSYTTVLGIMLLTLLSLIAISVHTQVSQALANLRRRIHSSSIVLPLSIRHRER